MDASGLLPFWDALQVPHSLSHTNRGHLCSFPLSALTEGEYTLSSPLLALLWKQQCSVPHNAQVEEWLGYWDNLTGWLASDVVGKSFPHRPNYTETAGRVGNLAAKFKSEKWKNLCVAWKLHISLGEDLRRTSVYREKGRKQCSSKNPSAYQLHVYDHMLYKKKIHIYAYFSFIYPCEPIIPYSVLPRNP